MGPMNVKLVGGVFFFACSAAMMAHHGISVSYQLDQSITLSGTVTEFSFSNPHPQMSLDVKDASGNVHHWTTEWVTSPGRLKRVSGDWSRNSIKPGDAASVICNPRKLAGTHDCLMRELTINGQKMNLGEDSH
ncbi:MAG: DUF6152 family protein [Bryobacteraceae bacterium]